MRILLHFLIIILFAVGTLTAQERAIDNFAGLGVRAMGMGGAYAGVADDYTAIHWNPAGLAQMQEREVYVAFLRNTYEGKATLANTRSTTELSNTRFGSLGLVYPYPVYQGGLVFAVGFNRVKDFDSAIRIRGFSPVDTLQQDNFFRHEGELSTTSLAGAVDISPEISLGMALNLWRGADERIDDIDQDFNPDATGFRLKTQDLYEDEYDGFNATLGMMIRSPRENPTGRLGLTVSSGVAHQINYVFKGVPPPEYSSTEYDRDFVDNLEELVPEEEKGSIEQGTDEEGNPYLVTNTGRRITDRGSTILEEVPSQTLNNSYKLALPLEFGIGFSLRPIPDLLLAGSAHLAEWSQSEYRGRDTEDLRSNVLFEEEYEDIIRYHLGLEWQVPVITLVLRAGYYSDPLPYVGPLDEEDIDPENTHLVLIKRDRRFFTLGAGMLFDQVMQVDAAWTRGGFEQVQDGGREESTISRTFISVGYRF